MTTTNSSRSAKALSVLNAEVTTATVTIKTITIDRRQVTLATFRQVPERDIFDEDANLRGVPWGRVNYCPGKHCSGGDDGHDHILWQQGADLFRCPFVSAVTEWPGWMALFHRQSEPTPLHDMTAIGQPFIEHVVAMIARRYPTSQWQPAHARAPFACWDSDGRLELEWRSGFTWRISEDGVGQLSTHAGNTYWVHLTGNVPEPLAAPTKRLLDGAQPILDEVTAHADHWEDLRDRYTAAAAVLLTLDQLYIAT